MDGTLGTLVAELVARFNARFHDPELALIAAEVTLCELIGVGVPSAGAQVPQRASPSMIEA